MVIAYSFKFSYIEFYFGDVNFQTIATALLSFRDRALAHFFIKKKATALLSHASPSIACSHISFSPPEADDNI